MAAPSPAVTSAPTAEDVAQARLARYYERQTAVAFDMMAVNFSQLRESLTHSLTHNFMSSCVVYSNTHNTLNATRLPVFPGDLPRLKAPIRTFFGSAAAGDDDIYQGDEEAS